MGKKKRKDALPVGSSITLTDPAIAAVKSKNILSIATQDKSKEFST